MNNYDQSRTQPIQHDAKCRSILHDHYDHAGRVIKTDYKINDKPTVTLADMSIGGYDELGRLILKKRHGGTDTESFQYNIRNWPTKITSGTFEENLYYNTKPSNIDQATPIYNGNICYSSWTYNGSARGYEYNYDELNRFTGGYAFINNEMQDSYQYSEWFNYNKMGNITYLNRNTFDDTIDQLNFNYNGNQISSITDAWSGRNQNDIKEYQDINDATVIPEEFIYDANGNLTTDLDRDIVTIRYNILNLPDIVQFKDGHQIINNYDASGKKLSSRYYTVLMKSEVPVVNTLQVGQVLNLQYNMDIIDETGTFYIDNFEYGFNGCDPGIYWIDKIYNSEGYCNEGPNNYSTYYYYRKDHLGNNREVWRTAFTAFGTTYPATTIQRTQYYPSGLPWAEGEGASVQNKKYNGKEFIEAHGLDVTDLGNRGLYHAINRFTTMDRFAEKYPWQSPYVFAGNNPILNIDIQGDSAWQIINQWNDKYITSYRTTLNTKIQQYINDGKEFTCEDMALSLLVDFASQNGLPVTISNGQGTYDARSDSYTDAEKFKNDILKYTGANDLQDSRNTTQISISNAKTGDIILNRYNGNDIGRHVQVISNVSFVDNTDNVNLVGITQGNSDWLNKIPGSSKFLGAGNPNSSFYTGTSIEKGSYNVNANVYTNHTTGKIYNKYSTVRNIVVRRWNFRNF